MDEFIGGGAGKQLLFLFLLTTFLVLLFTGIGLVLGLGVDENFSGNIFARIHETLWYYFTRVLDAGSMGGDAGLINRMVSTIATVLGVVVAGLLISALAGNFQERLEAIRRGGAPVMESQHFLLLGWSEKIFSVIDQLAEAYAANGKICCVVMAERDKVEMEDALANNVQYRDRVKLVVRSGSSVSLQDLEKVSFDLARAIVVLLNDSDRDDPASADARVMKTLMAIFNHPVVRARNIVPRVTAEVLKNENQELAWIASNRHAHVVRTNEMISKVILQTARISGLSLVYDELLRFEGNEIHIKALPQMTGRRVVDILLDFPNALLVGVAKKDGSGHVLNPAAEHVIGADEDLLLLAEDANIAVLPYTGPLRQHPLPTLEGNNEKRVEHMLVLGWNEKVFPMLREFDDYVAERSTITFVSGMTVEAQKAEVAREIGTTKNLVVRHLEGEFTSRALMELIAPQNYPTVMVLGDAAAGSAEAADTRAIIALLLLRDVRQRFSVTGQRVCSEILDPKNRELAATTELNDIVISNEMVSMVLAQITYEPKIQPILEDLLRSEGSEIYVKPMTMYAPIGAQVSFEYLVLLAKQRGEMALGLQQYVDDAKAKFGLVLNPRDRARVFHVSAADRLVVLAEEDG